jgi:hypothetical protein
VGVDGRRFHEQQCDETAIPAAAAPPSFLLSKNLNAFMEQLQKTGLSGCVEFAFLAKLLAF